jgi:endoglycosylceramidase
MKMLKVIVLIAALMLTLEAAIHVRKGRLVDDRGGELIFHGLNVVSKVPPYHTAFNENDMQHFQELGINGIRLGVMWPGVEPKKGEFNDSYLQLMLNTVKQSAKYGIYTLV